MNACQDPSCPSYGQMGAICDCQPSDSACFAKSDRAEAEQRRHAKLVPHYFLASIKAKFATPEHYAAAVKAVGEIMRERDEAQKWAGFYERAQSAAMTIIGDEFSLDPPDGGDVTLGEAAQRLRAAYETASRERDAARAFISDVVHMQSGAGWTRAMMREAAVEFLTGCGLKPHAPVDTTPAFAMVADLRASLDQALAERDAARALLREAGEALRIWDEAHQTGRSEPLFIARDAARAFLDKLKGDGK